MKIIIWILWIIWTWFFSGYLYFSNQDLANIIFYVTYYIILIFVLVLLWKFFSWIINIFWYDHFEEKHKPVSFLFVIIWIISLITICNFLWSKSFENNLRNFSNDTSSRIKIEKWKAPIIDLSSNTNTWTTK